MYRRARVTVVFVAMSVAMSVATAGAQSVAEYRARVDSLARLWRPLAAKVTATRVDSSRLGALPPVSFRVGPIAVRTDSMRAPLARRAAEHLVPRVEATYGRFSE